MADGKCLNADGSPSTGGDAAFLKIVQSGVKRFILDKANVQEALRTYKDENYSHPLTGAVLTKIVNDAMKEQIDSVQKTRKPENKGPIDRSQT